jgi:hypothetical protein
MRILNGQPRSARSRPREYALDGTTVVRVLTQPTQALTDLLLGLVVIGLAIALHRVPAVQRYWRAAFWWAGIAALAGFVHHGFIARWPDVARVSWAIVSVMVVLAVSYLLAATVEEVLGPGHARAFWLLRSIGVLAYAGLAATGHAGITALLACESLTMAFVIGLWSWAAYQGYPLARPVLLAIAASAAAAGTKALSPKLTGYVYLDPTSTYHLAQIVGMVLLFRALTERRKERSPAAGDGSVAASAR